MPVRRSCRGIIKLISLIWFSSAPGSHDANCFSALLPVRFSNVYTIMHSKYHRLCALDCLYPCYRVNACELCFRCANARRAACHRNGYHSLTRRNPRTEKVGSGVGDKPLFKEHAVACAIGLSIVATTSVKD